VANLTPHHGTDYDARLLSVANQFDKLSPIDYMISVAKCVPPK